MSKTKFTKMHGCGNDLIYFDGTKIQNPEILAVKLSDRHKSIGGDGIVLILPSSVADAKMRMFNADGSEGLMCGNSIRCVGKYMYDQGIVDRLHITIETSSGVKNLELIYDKQKEEVIAAKVDMGPAEISPDKIPVNLSGAMVVARPVNLVGNTYEITCVSMGNPHAIIFTTDLEHTNVQAVGQAFEESDLFPEGVNVGITQIDSRNRLQMKVWERGTGKTMASGTGACAAAVAAVLMGYADKDTNIDVVVDGGTLTVEYTDSTVYMTGDCITIYEGMIEL